MNKEIEQEQYSSMVNSNTILLSLEGWIKYIEGFTKGLQTAEMVNSACVLDCVGEILEFMLKFKTNLTKLFIHCEKVLEENEVLKSNKPKLLTSSEPITIEDKIYEELKHGKDL